MIYYAAHTTGARNRSTLRDLGFGMLGSAGYRWTDSEWRARDQGGLGWALDNGAWGYFQAGRPFDGEAFKRAVSEAGRLDFVVVPDAVMDDAGTRRLAEKWLPWTLANADARRVLLPVQEGMELDELPLDDRIGVFVGGDSRWKERKLHHWRTRTKEAGAYLHVGRVNTARRLRICLDHGVDSCDGSGAAKFSIHAERIALWLREFRAQTSLFGHLPVTP